MEPLRTPPSRSDFTLLSEHQSQTPTSFHDGPTILYHQSSGCTLRISSHDLAATAALESLVSATRQRGNGQVNGHINEETPAGEEHGNENIPDVEILDVDVWVTSERFILFSPLSNAGTSISYPSISLHAVQRPTHSSPTSAPALYLQLLPEANATFDDHDPEESISLYIAPNVSSNAATPISPGLPSETEAGSELANASSDEISKIYSALSACANLHPDPLLDDDDEMDQDNDNGITGQHPAISFLGQAESGIDGVFSLDGEAVRGLPPPMPGSGGWITADNVGEFFDQDGNWRGRGEESGGALGEGAGRTRAREDEDVEGGEGEETKWTRTG